MTIEIPSRYHGLVTKLHPLNEYIYEVDSFGCRVIYSKDNKTIEAIDPPGGPFMSLGDIINSKYKIIQFSEDKPKKLFVTLEEV